MNEVSSRRRLKIQRIFKIPFQTVNELLQRFTVYRILTIRPIHYLSSFYLHNNYLLFEDSLLRDQAINGRRIALAIASLQNLQLNWATKLMHWYQQSDTI